MKNITIVNAIVAILVVVGLVLLLADLEWGIVLVVIGIIGFVASVNTQLATLHAKIKAIEEKSEKG